MMTRPRFLFASLIGCISVSNFGQSISTRKPNSVSIQRQIAKVVSCLPPPVIIKGEQPSCTALTQQMTDLHIPGVSIAVIHNGSIEWAQGFGVTKIGGGPVTANTLFQVGSISKPVSAMAVLYQAQKGKLSLDADVNTELILWKVPASPAANGKPVTLRELLTHTAGMTN